MNIRRTGRQLEKLLFEYREATAANLEADEPFPATDANRTLSTYKVPASLRQGIINRIQIRLTPTNAVTPRVYILKYHSTTDLSQEEYLLFDTGITGLVSGTYYDFTELDIPFILTAPGSMYYLIDWSGAPGATTGFIQASGEVIK